MAESTQHILVLIIVSMCALFILWQAFGSYFGRKSSLGKCCEKGCDPAKQAQEPKEQFLPAESLARKKPGT